MKENKILNLKYRERCYSYWKDVLNFGIILCYFFIALIYDFYLISLPPHSILHLHSFQPNFINYDLIHHITAKVFFVILILPAMTRE